MQIHAKLAGLELVTPPNEHKRSRIQKE